MSSFWHSFPRVEAGLKRVRLRLQHLAEALPGDLQHELSPLIRREGKSLRAGLMVLAADQVGEEQRDAVDAAAAAVELLHLATLVHDDIVDQAGLRRGEPALHRKLGPQRAVLYGDLLFAAAFRSVSRDVGTESARALADLVTVMAATEIQQLNDRFSWPSSPRRILRRTMGKTALLFSLSLYVGAQEARRPAALTVALRRAGYSLGMAFQLQDDLLDWTGDPKVLGKPILEDLAAGIYTWPLALAWRSDPKRTQRTLSDVREGRMSAEEFRSVWAGAEIWKQTEELVTVYAQRARRDLDRALGTETAERLAWERFIAELLGRRS